MGDITGLKIEDAILIEKTVLGSIILKPDKIVDVYDIIKETDFYMPQHRLIYSSLKAMFIEKKPIDMVTLYTRLKGMGKEEEAGGLGYINQLADTPVTTANISWYAEHVRTSSIRRQIWLGCDEAQHEFMQTEDPEEIEKIKTKLINLLINCNPLKENEKDVVSVQEILQRIDVEHQNPTGEPTGLIELDNYTNIFAGGRLTIIGGRPRMGKTTLAREFILRTYKKLTPLFFSMEENDEAIVEKLICSTAAVEFFKYDKQRRFLNQETIRKLKMIQAQMYEHFKLYVSPKYTVDAKTVVATVRKMVLQNNKPGVVFIDYLQLMDYNRSAHNLSAVVGAEVVLLKRMSVSENIPVILLSQLNRKSEDRSDARPHLADLRESGDIEQHADNVIFIWTDDIENETKRTITVAKQKAGPQVEFDLFFDSKTMHLDNLSNKEYEGGGGHH